MATDGLGALRQVEADSVVVLRRAIKLEPEYVRRDFGDAFDRRAADRAERVWDAGSLRRACQILIGAGPDDGGAAHRRNANRRRVTPAKQFDLARRQRRHHAVARHHFHRIEPRPIAPDPGVVLARAAVAIFKREMRQPPACAAAQIIDGRITSVKRGVARIGVFTRVGFRLRCDPLYRLDGRRVVHARFSLSAHYSRSGGDKNSIQTRYEKIADACETVGPAGHTDAAGRSQCAIACLEQNFTIERNDEACADNFDAERLRLLHRKRRRTAGNFAIFTVKDAQEVHAAAEQIGLDNVIVLRIGKAQHDAHGARDAAIVCNKRQFGLDVCRHRAVGDAKRQPVGLRLAAHFNQGLAIQQQPLELNLPHRGTAKSADGRRAAVGA